MTLLRAPKESDTRRTEMEMSKVRRYKRARVNNLLEHTESLSGGIIRGKMQRMRESIPRPHVALPLLWKRQVRDHEGSELGVPSVQHDEWA